MLSFLFFLSFSYFFKSQQVDSNHRLSAYEAGTLPTELYWERVAGEGFEPPLHGLWGRAGAISSPSRESEWQDSNLRLRGPKPRPLAKLSYTPKSKLNLIVAFPLILCQKTYFLDYFYLFLHKIKLFYAK